MRHLLLSSFATFSCNRLGGGCRLGRGLLTGVLNEGSRVLVMEHWLLVKVVRVARDRTRVGPLLEGALGGGDDHWGRPGGL